MDYEALGRYTAAKETAIKAARERNRALADLSRLIGSCIGNEGSGMLAARYDAVRARDLLDAAGLADGVLTRALAEANAVHAAAGKPALTLG
jgi:hypothetical protein